MLGVELVQQIPELGVFGAPMVAAAVVVLYRLGLDGFCQWVDSGPSADVYYRE